MAKQKRYNGYLRKSFTYNGKRIYVYGKTAQELLENEVKKKEELATSQQDLYNPTLNSYYVLFTNIRRREIKESVVNGRFCPQSVRSFCPVVAGFNAGTYKVPACVL